MSASSRRPRHAGSIPTGTPRTDGSAGWGGESGRITIFPSSPPARGGRLSPVDIWLLDLWLDGCTESEMAAEMSLMVEEVRERRRQLWDRLQALKPGDPTPAAG